MLPISHQALEGFGLGASLLHFGLSFSFAMETHFLNALEF